MKAKPMSYMGATAQKSKRHTPEELKLITASAVSVLPGMRNSLLRLNKIREAVYAGTPIAKERRMPVSHWKVRTTEIGRLIHGLIDEQRSMFNAVITPISQAVQFSLQVKSDDAEKSAVVNSNTITEAPMTTHSVISLPTKAPRKSPVYLKAAESRMLWQEWLRLTREASPAANPLDLLFKAQSVLKPELHRSRKAIAGVRISLDVLVANGYLKLDDVPVVVPEPVVQSKPTVAQAEDPVFLNSIVLKTVQGLELQIQGLSKQVAQIFTLVSSLRANNVAADEGIELAPMEYACTNASWTDTLVCVVQDAEDAQLLANNLYAKLTDDEDNDSWNLGDVSFSAYKIFNSATAVIEALLAHKTEPASLAILDEDYDAFAENYPLLKFARSLSKVVPDFYDDEEA